MRNETYYYASGTSLEQSEGIKFAAIELVERVIESGYIIEGVCNLSGHVLVMNTLRFRKLLPQDVWVEWKEEILDDKLKIIELEKSGQAIQYHFGISEDFRQSPCYWQWLHRVCHKLKIENVYGEPLEGENGEQMSYLLTDRSGKALMLEYLKNETETSCSNISLDDKRVYEFLSESIKYEGHPYLPDDPAFDLGIWGYPGIGTKQCTQALKEMGRIKDFKNLVEVTRVALSFAAGKNEDDTCVEREVSITEAILEALVAYYMAWYYLYATDVWKEAYQKAYLNPVYLNEWKEETWDGDLLIEKSRKEYWEKILMLEIPDETDEYKDYLMPFPMDMETILGFMEKIAIKEGSLAIEEYGFMVLQETYLDFWEWLHEEQAYQKDEMLERIACYTENDEVKTEKEKLLEVVKKYNEYTLSNLAMPVFFHSDKPQISYIQRRRMIAKSVEIERNQYFKELLKYSHSFTKFSIKTESAALFRQSSKRESQRYLRDIDTYDLCRAFVLYFPSHRDWIMESMSLRLRNRLLEDMKEYVKGEDFSLEDCVQAEQNITEIIRKIQEKQFKLRLV